MQAPFGYTDLDLQSTLREYFEYCPDLFARAHHDAMVDGLEDKWQFASKSWDWLRQRLEQDCTPLQNIADCGYPGNWDDEWDCWDNFATGDWN